MIRQYDAPVYVSEMRACCLPKTDEILLLFFAEANPQTRLASVVPLFADQRRGPGINRYFLAAEFTLDPALFELHLRIVLHMLQVTSTTALVVRAIRGATGFSLVCFDGQKLGVPYFLTALEHAHPDFFPDQCTRHKIDIAPGTGNSLPFRIQVVDDQAEFTALS